MSVSSHRDLVVWQKAVELSIACYAATKGFPRDERFGLTSQLQRAAVSVAANIAEGRGRGTTNGFLNFLWIATGSLTELDTHIVIARRLDYLNEQQYRELESRVEEVGRMLTGLRRSLGDSSD
ncbi:MAG: four helix bundle protein [Planctomycetaceae bacterium]|nr:four helix bundle protein [Planctomycetaceae bacterium]